jgi:hypothetical protein
MPRGYSDLPFVVSAREAFRGCSQYAFVMPATLGASFLDVLARWLVAAGAA